MRFSYLILLIFILIFIPATAWAKLPPPPVNQNMGMPDVSYATSPMTFQTCLACHGDPANAPAPVKIGYLPDRHHLRVDTPIEEYSDSPYPEDSTDGTHKCITCHKTDWIEDPSRPLGGYFKFAEEPTDPEFRNCLNCHQQPINKYGYLMATAHHLTPKAQKKLCYQCHGAIVNNATDESRIPDPYDDKARNCSTIDPTAIDPDNPIPLNDSNNYDISLITPWPGDNYFDLSGLRIILKDFYSECPDVAATYSEQGGKYQINPPRYRYEIDGNGDITAILVPDGVSGGRRTGNCEHCHYAGNNPGNAVQANTGLAKLIGTNMGNHHGTGVGQPKTGSVHSCGLCHSPEAPPNFTINGCKLCHGISTLHSIEYDAEGDGIEPGNEKPFMGHIGNKLNCRGCHLNFRSTQFSQNNQSRALNIRAASTNESMFGELTDYDIPAPYLESLSTVGMVAGTQTNLTITGSGFFTQSNGPIPRVELVNTQGIITEIYLNRSAVTETTINVTIPATMPPDIYELYVIRGQRYTQGDSGRDYSKRSASVPFLIAPDVAIDSVNCSDGTVTINGTGFGNMFTADKYGNEGFVDSLNQLGIDGGGLSCIVKSWSNTQIIAQCEEDTNTINLNSLYGEASSDVACGDGRPDWWALWSWFASWGWSGR